MFHILHRSITYRHQNIKIGFKILHIFLDEPIIIDFDFIVSITISLLVHHSCRFIFIQLSNIIEVNEMVDVRRLDEPWN